MIRIRNCLKPGLRISSKPQRRPGYIFLYSGAVLFVYLYRTKAGIFGILSGPILPAAASSPDCKEEKYAYKAHYSVFGC